MIRLTISLLLASITLLPSSAKTVHVPRDHATIQAAIDASASGDIILVSPGTYLERIRMKKGISLRSEGNDEFGTQGLKRAEATVLDGGGDFQNQPGVMMADASTLDGFTITRIGRFDEAIWKQHHNSQGEELGDDEGSVQAEGTVPAIRIEQVHCVVKHCIVHHNGDVGIGILGRGEAKLPSLIVNNFVYRNLGGGIGIAEAAEALVQNNRCKLNLRAGIGCRAASPLIVGNLCSENIRAGIGCREAAKPVIRGNACFQNRRAGIGIRMDGTAPLVEDNKCYENDMAGIGSRDGATPVIRNNLCHDNKMAGIGCDGSAPVITGNECRNNQMAGIGLRSVTNAVVQQNQCLENKLVAIGITHGSTAIVTQNDLSRTGGGAPPLVAVKDGSTATIQGNRIAGGGVAGILVQGQANIRGNAFQGAGDKQGNAIWVWQGSSATVTDNEFIQYGAAVNATRSDVVIRGNTIRQFRNTAIVVKESSHPPIVVGNRAISSDAAARVIDIQGLQGTSADNELEQQ
jgi:hypothetical protein